MNKYYVYIHRKDNGQPFYVGKGSGNRAWDFSGRNHYWQRVSKKHGVNVDIVFESLTEDEAFQCEKDVILELEYFGCTLCNMTSGGEGSSGLQFTDTQRLTISKSLKGRKPWNVGLSKPKENKPSIYTDETRRKMSVAKRGVYTGEKNPYADTNIYTFVRLSDGFVVQTTRAGLVRDFGANLGLIKKLFYKVPRKSADGWRLAKENEYDNSAN